MIDAELRAQMLAFTAGDVPPPDLLQRVSAGVRRRRSRRLAVVGGVAVAASVATASLAAGLGAPGGGGQSLAQTSPSPQPEPDRSPGLGPSDEELRAASWFHYTSQPNQPGTERSAERRWEHRDGRHVAQWGDGRFEQISTESVFPFGKHGVSWEELQALPADPDELDRRMREVTGGRPDTERVLDQVRQLLGRSPALTTVRKALIDAALLHEGVTLSEGERDSQGRPAMLLEHTDRDGAVLRLFVDPAGFRLLEEQTVAGPDFPTPPTDGPAPADDPRPAEAPAYDEGDLLYAEVFLSWGTAAPPAS